MKKYQYTSACLRTQVSHIDPGTPIKLYLYAENAKGTSDPAIIDDASLNQQKHYVEGKDMKIQRLKMSEWADVRKLELIFSKSVL